MWRDARGQFVLVVEVELLVCETIVLDVWAVIVLRFSISISKASGDDGELDAGTG